MGHRAGVADAKEQGRSDRAALHCGAYRPVSRA